MTASSTVRNSVAIGSPLNPDHVVIPNDDGSINVVITGGGGSGGTSSDFSDAFPAAGTAIGAEDPSGNMAPIHVDSSGNLLIAGSFSASFSEATQDDTGSTAGANVIFTQASTVGYYSSYFQIASVGTSTVVAEVQNNGAWVPTLVAPIGSLVGQTSITANGMYVASTGGKGFRLRVSVWDGTSTIAADGFFRGYPVTIFPASQTVTFASGSGVTANAGTNLNTSALNLETTQSAFKTANHTDLAAINTTLGSPFQAGASIGNASFGATQSGAWNITNIVGTVSLPTGASTSALQTTGNGSLATIATNTANAGTPTLQAGSTTAVTQPSAASLNATVVGTGTFAAQVTQAGTWTVGISASQTIGVTQATASNLNAQVVGPTASGASLSANPVTTGGLAATALPTAVSNGQVVNSLSDKFGRNITRSAPRELLTTAALSTTGTSGTLLAAQGVNVFADMYRLVIANSSATAVLVTISDGTNSYGYEVPANGTVGFSGSAADATPAASTNTAWTYAVATGTTTIYISAQFILNH